MEEQPQDLGQEAPQFDWVRALESIKEVTVYTVKGEKGVRLFIQTDGSCDQDVLHYANVIRDWLLAYNEEVKMEE